MAASLPRGPDRANFGTLAGSAAPRKTRRPRSIDKTADLRDVPPPPSNGQENRVSHFVVIVVGQDVDAALAPFQENNMGDCPREFLAFVDNEDDFRVEHETESAPFVAMPDGTFVTPHDTQPGAPHWRDATAEERALGADALRERFRFVRESLNSRDLKVFDPSGGGVLRDVPFKEVYPDFDDFAADWHSSERDERTGRYGYWENPNRKWDWYEVGGRWTGYFLPKPGKTGELGLPGSGDNKPKPGWVDKILKGDIDFEAMEAQAKAEALATWDALAAACPAEVFAGMEGWKQVLDRLGEERVTEARDLFWDQAQVREFKSRMARVEGDAAERLRWADPEWAAAVLAMGRDAFATREANSTWIPFAVLLDGKWNANGSMGWFGIVTDEKDNADWSNAARTAILGLPDDALLTAVDCHI
jgi:hypothetical protein